MKKNNRLNGFTLIELMITVAIIGILAAIALPKFGELVRKSREGKTKGNISSLRSAIHIYYSDNLGLYPTGTSESNSTGLQDMLVNKYAEEIPDSHCPTHHPKTKSCDFIDSLSAFSLPCEGKWVYVGNQSSSDWGSLRIGCEHTDYRGNTWFNY